EAQARAVRQEEALPGDEHALLAVDDVMVVETDQPRALRDQEVFPAVRVVDVLADLAEDLPGQLRVDGAEHDRGDDRPRLQLVGGHRPTDGGPKVLRGETSGRRLDGTGCARYAPAIRRTRRRGGFGTRAPRGGVGGAAL